MTRQEFTRKVKIKIIKASNSSLTKDEIEQTAHYLWIYLTNSCTQHWQVNNIITKSNMWDQFKEIRSMNDHGFENKIRGIKPKFFAIVCELLEIGGDDGRPLLDYEAY